MWMDQVTRGWLMYDITGSALDLGLVNAVRLLPIIFLSPLAGVMADRYGRKTQLIADQLTNAAVNFLLAMLVITHQVQPWHVYATGFLTAILQVFQQPARQALVPETVDRAHLTNAIGLNSLVFNASRALGPAVAGAIVALVGAGGSYIVQGLIYIFASQWTAQLRVPNKPPMRASGLNAQASSFGSSAIQGWRFVLHNPIIRAGIIASMLPALMGQPFTVLLPVFASDVLDVGPQGQGLLLTCMGVGAVCSAFLIASVGDKLPKGKLMTAGMTTYGLAMLVFARSAWFPLSLAIMVAIGLCNVMTNALVQTVVQAHSPPELRGRVMGVYQQNQLLINVGALLAGVFASLWGAQVSVEIMGASLVTAAVAAFIAIPTIRAIR
jgi:MFS family permease